jgi:integrase
MALYKRGNTWWVRFTTPDGREVRRSARTERKRDAQEFHDRLKAETWRVKVLSEQPRRKWQDAVERWLSEKAHKASLCDDIYHLRWLHPHLYDRYLDEIDRTLLDGIQAHRVKDGVSNATVNRMLEVVRGILRAAHRDWEWLDAAPSIRMLAEPKRRVRWLQAEEVERLLGALPEHLQAMVRFSLATGLRERNVTHLEWSQLDLDRRIAWIHPDQAKARKAIAVPLNAAALAVLREQLGRHSERVFTFRGQPIAKANTKAWRRALLKAGITNFRWHDLRHTWASYHVQQGTPVNALQELGGWSNAEMVRRYAHLSVEHLAEYAERLCAFRTNSGTAREEDEEQLAAKPGN